VSWGEERGKEFTYFLQLTHTCKLIYYDQVQASYVLYNITLSIQFVVATKTRRDEIIVNVAKAESGRTQE
jgi:hypothetical protein